MRQIKEQDIVETIGYQTFVGNNGGRTVGTGMCIDERLTRKVTSRKKQKVDQDNNRRAKRNKLGKN